ncbi:DUF2768 domain-containing protein [Jeotgalibacillus salarius]|uniref:DUF2768 domain-containing protein n=1 Tax=Jeotgalibacillus salarius TaxID=546023 RepID=A0A4Y8LKJ1_9BACL|nr:DUF2768 domain-containing protein [Jeotgalibacillus salarius]TFE03095.1 DUF2768 domain-containing protein [Jeotgalibacillus salarius]
MDALTKMWVSFGSMGFMFLAIIIIYISRYKISNKVIKFITAFAAYIFMILAGLIMLWVVFSGPTMEV